MLNSALYDLMMETHSALFGAISAIQTRSEEQSEPVPVLLQVRSGFAESPAWFMVQAAEFDPEPLTVTNLRMRDVYASPFLVRGLLELLASEQWLDRSPQETFLLTPVGRTIVTRILGRPHKLIPRLDGVPIDLVEGLASLLSHVIEARLASSTPPGTWCLAHSRNRAPDKEAPTLVQIHQYFSDFNAFRDDAHMAAWKSQDIDGYVWEAFALLCSGEATSVDTVYDQIPYRGYSRSEYAAALSSLTQRGWLHTNAREGRYNATEAGLAIRESVEKLTDEYFYAPWTCLSDEEIRTIPSLLTQLRDCLYKIQV